nr:hypothetical protein [Tanacetum cinerariifolium]
MRTRSSSSNLPVESSPNPTSFNPKGRNRIRSKQPFILEESPVDTMADQRTMAELIRIPIEGFVEAIMVLSILVEHFELKHSLINMMTSDQFFRLEKDNHHDHIRMGSIQRSPSWMPSSWFTELHQLNTFYNALNPTDQDSLNSAAGGNLLERRTQDVLTIIENKSKIAKLTYVVNQQTRVVTTVMIAILKQFQATPPPAFVKAVEEICVTCGGAHLGIVLDGPSVSIPRPFINPEEDERVEETLMDQDLAEYTIKVPPPLVQRPKPPSQKNFVVHQRDPLHLNIPYPLRMHKQKQQEKDKKMLKALFSNKEKFLELANIPLNENCSAVILKKLPEKLRNPRKFLIPCGFSKLKCKALADLVGIARDVFVSVGKFTFPSDFVIVDYESDLRVPLILGRPLLRTARALIDMISLNPEGDMVLIKELINHDSTKDLPPPHNINPLSSSTTSSSLNHLLEEFTDELALITFPSRNNDLPFDIESDLKEIEYLLNHDPIKEMDSILKDSVDKGNLADLNDNLVDTIPEIFTDEHALDYSSPPYVNVIDSKRHVEKNLFVKPFLIY